MSESNEVVQTDGPPAPTTPSVRELLAELAALEDATRGLGGILRPRWTAQAPDLQAALVREQEIIAELRRRCDDAPDTGLSVDDGSASGRTD